MEEVRLSTRVADARTEKVEKKKDERLVALDFRDPAKRAKTIAALERQMQEAAANLEFEVAAMLRDQINELRALDARCGARWRCAGAGAGSIAPAGMIAP